TAVTRPRATSETSSFGLIGVSIGISMKCVHEAVATTAATLTTVLAKRAFMDFPEQVVVLLDVLIVRIDLQRLLIGVIRLFEIALLLVGDRQIVPCGGVRGVDVGGALELRDRFTPEIVLRDLDAELHVLLRPLTSIGGEHRRRHRQTESRHKI